MRICFIALGKFTHIPPYLEYFREAGHDVHLVALAPGPKRDVPTHDVGSEEKFPRLLAKWAYLPAMIRARRVVRSLSPDIVHAHYATSAGLAAYVCGMHPYIVTAHGSDVVDGVKSIVWRRILRTVFRNADCINPVSDELRDQVLGLGISPEKVETFTLGIDTKKFGFRGGHMRDPRAPLRLICTRRFEEVYNHRTIITALAILARQGIDFRLTLVGPGPLRECVRAQAREQGIERKTIFVGAVSNSRLPELLGRHHVYLSASRSDGASLCLLEAMAAGVYPIVSDISANRLWIRNGFNGLLHKTFEPQSLADCLLAYLREPTQTAAALRVNREMVERKGDRETNMRRLEQVYRRLTQSADRRFSTVHTVALRRPPSTFREH